MYNIGEVVTLLIDKSEGAGDGSLTVSSGVTGMIANAGRACGNSFSYVVNFGPEGQWNCRHNELESLMSRSEPEGTYYEDNEEEVEEECYDWEQETQDITEEEAQRVYADESLRPGADLTPPPIPHTLKKENKIVSFEEDLARMVASRK